METVLKRCRINIQSSELTELADNAILTYQHKVKRETGGRISRAKAIVKILEKSDYALK